MLSISQTIGPTLVSGLQQSLPFDLFWSRQGELGLFFTHVRQHWYWRCYLLRGVVCFGVVEGNKMNKVRSTLCFFPPKCDNIRPGMCLPLIPVMAPLLKVCPSYTGQWPVVTLNILTSKLNTHHRNRENMQCRGNVKRIRSLPNVKKRPACVGMEVTPRCYIKVSPRHRPS